jgi:hypothetical protein
MTDYKRIKKLLERKPFLVADAVTGEVGLTDQKTAFQLLTKADPFPSHAILNVGGGLEKFSQVPAIGKDNREFGMREIAKMAGMSYNLFYHYMVKEVIVPSVRPVSGHSGRGEVEARFSWSDAWVAGIIGALRRSGLKMKVLRKVQPLFSNSKNQADRELVTPGRP